MKHLRTRAFFGMLVMLVLILSAVPVQAARTYHHRPESCPSTINVNQWHSIEQLNRNGFNIEVTPPVGSLRFMREGPDRFLALDIANAMVSGLISSRITEIESLLPIAERVKCWQPTDRKDVRASYELRFDRATAPLSLTENMFFWNAFLPTRPGLEPPIPATVVGVSRNGGNYIAVLAQDLNLMTGQAGVLITKAMPSWLDPTDWHRIDITMSTQRVVIEVSQGYRHDVQILKNLPRPLEPLALEFSLDNETSPGSFSSVVEHDGVDVGSLSIRYVTRH